MENFEVGQVYVREGTTFSEFVLGVFDGNKIVIINDRDYALDSEWRKFTGMLTNALQEKVRRIRSEIELEKLKKFNQRYGQNGLGLLNTDFTELEKRYVAGLERQRQAEDLRKYFHVATPDVETWLQTFSNMKGMHVQGTITGRVSAKQENTSNSGRSDGSTADYYQLPKGATQLQDLISHRNMNAQLGEIFRACYRFGMASHSDQLRDAKKIKFYIEAEIKRLEDSE